VTAVDNLERGCLQETVLQMAEPKHYQEEKNSQARIAATQLDEQRRFVEESALQTELDVMPKWKQRQNDEVIALQFKQEKQKEDERRKPELEATRQVEVALLADEETTLKRTFLGKVTEVLPKKLPSIRSKKVWVLIVASVLVLLVAALAASPGTGEVALANGMYKGQLKDGKPEGYGTVTYKDGSKFEGHFRGGKRQGQGKLIAADGKTVAYEGEWKDDKRNGKGQSYEHYSDKDDKMFIKYNGLWVNDVKQGAGVAWIYKNGEEIKRCEGNFENGRMTDADAKVFFHNGDKYRGGVVNDHFSGQGTYTFASGGEQRGLWANDCFVR
jgi:hypothetical protein